MLHFGRRLLLLQSKTSLCRTAIGLNVKVVPGYPIVRCFSKEAKEKKEADDEYETVEEEITDDEQQHETTGNGTHKTTPASGVPIIKDCYYETLGVSKDAN